MRTASGRRAVSAETPGAITWYVSAHAATQSAREKLDAVALTAFLEGNLVQPLSATGAMA